MARPMRRAYFRIARELGFASPDHWLRSITSRQLTEYLAYLQLEQDGALVDNLASAAVQRVQEARIKRKRRAA